PPTPPDVRVRIRRFGELRSRGKPRQAEVVEVARGQGDVDLQARVSPPAPGVASNLVGFCVGESPSAKLPIHGRLVLPVLQLERPQAVADPSIEVAEDAGRVGELEVVLPPNEVPA